MRLRVFLCSLRRFSQSQSFVDILNEMNDYAGQREVVAENMMMNICIELTKYSQDIKQERKMVRGRMERGRDMKLLLKGIPKCRTDLIPLPFSFSFFWKGGKPSIIWSAVLNSWTA